MTTHRPTRIEIELTDGNLRHDSIPIPADALDYLLEDASGNVAPRRALTLHLQGLKDPIHTDVDNAKRMISSRRWRTFFERHGLRAGDRLAINRLSRTDFGVWPLLRG